MTPAGTPITGCAPSALAACRAVHIGIGSNIDPTRHIRAALRLLAGRMRVHDISPVYRSQPVGMIGPDFLNLAVMICCQSSLRALKTALDDIEAVLGRPRLSPAPGQRPRARTIDLDILLDGPHVGAYGTRPWRLPHPDILRYEHVAVPLSDIAGHLRHPGTGRRLADIATELARGGITRTELDLAEAIS
jgi:2-amino-4-hydroxy-6-hydroxymethyldihydropteridine diphosphokinase